MEENKCCKKNVWDELELLSGDDDDCPASLNAPTGLTAVEVTGTRIDLSWTAPAQTVTGYKIERSVDDGAWATLVADTGTTTVTYSDTSVTAGTINTYRVTALNVDCTLTSSASSTAEDYAFSNAQARTGYSGVVTGNGGAINYSIYDTAPRTVKVKEGLDNLFVTGASNGWLAKAPFLYLLFGGTSGAHAINVANPGTRDLTFVNSPTHGKNGVTLNGTTQYARTGIIDSDLTQNNVHLSAKTLGITATGTQTRIGSSNSATQRTANTVGSGSGGTNFLQAHTSTAGAGMLTLTTLGAGVLNVYVTMSRRTATDIEGYLDGVTDGTSATGGGTEPTVELYIGALNSSGSAINFLNGTMQYASAGTSFTDSNASSMVTALQTFYAILGR